MYSLTLELNQICNLHCSYCYLGDKDGSLMKTSTAKRAIDLAFEKTKIHKDGKLWVDFIGGEPLISFDKIRHLIAYIEDKNQGYRYDIQYSLTTNATLLTEAILKYLSANGVNLKISLDGKKAINDKNRMGKDGISVHDEVLKCLPLLRRYERETGKYVQVTNVITRNNFCAYSDTLVYLTDCLGFKIIDSALDLTAPWTDDELAAFEEILQDALDYFIDRAAAGQGFQWDFARMMVRCMEEKKRFYTCGGGIISMYVRTDGSIFACPGNLHAEVSLGDVKRGYDRNKIDRLKTFTGIDNSRCRKCALYASCTANCCMMQNILLTGDRNRPAPVLCYMQKALYRLYQKNEAVLSRLTM